MMNNIPIVGFYRLAKNGMDKGKLSKYSPTSKVEDQPHVCDDP